ncbi:hypothetical protein EDC04DRAFT_2625417 [Pisolithus marmoratus]|nr:hypothetical protein EDC04DRAFT_2625417 [Pisolithus marmoratus]
MSMVVWHVVNLVCMPEVQSIRPNFICLVSSERRDNKCGEQWSTNSTVPIRFPLVKEFPSGRMELAGSEGLHGIFHLIEGAG